MAQAYLSLEKAKQAVRDAVGNSKRGSRNARGGSGAGGCVYTNDAGEHCIVAQVLEDNSIPLPEPRAGYFCGEVADPYVDKGYMSADTADFLYRCQLTFDEDITWRKALRACQKQGLL